MIVSVHVPKSAGTSFKRVLTEVCHARIWFNYGSIFAREQARAGVVPDGTEIIFGHFLADAFDDLYPDRTLITWVRHPVERVVSHYHHFRRAPDMRDGCCRDLHDRNLSLLEFASLEWMCNETSRYLSYKPVRAFEFVGIAESFDESMGQFCDHFGFRRPSRMPVENTNPLRAGSRYDLSARERDHILACNQDDLAWYEEALARHDRASAGLRRRIA